MKIHLSKEEKYLIIFLIFCFISFLVVRYSNIKKFEFSIQKITQEKQIVFPLDLNSVSFQELIQIPGIGPVIAEQIIQYRYEKGKFNNLEELKQIKGIGEKKFKLIKGYFKI